MPCLGDQQRVQADEVRVAHERVALDIGCLQLALAGRVGADGIVVEHAHVEAERSSGYRPSDPAEADDAERLAIDVVAPEEVPLPAGPLPRARETVGRDDASRGSHEQGPREVGGRLRQHVGGIGHHDPARLAGRHIDVVEADRHVADGLQSGR